MPNIKYDWEEIITDMADVISKEIANKHKVPTIKYLYDKLKKRYNEKEKPFPAKQEIFSKRIHSDLGLEKNRKNYAPYFRQLAGKYDKMTLDNLAAGISVSGVNSGDSSNLMFIRIDNKDGNPYPEVQKHLYFLSQRLKEKFSNEIVFISFDIDTIVIICRDDVAQQEVKSYFSHINKMSAL